MSTFWVCLIWFFICFSAHISIVGFYMPVAIYEVMDAQAISMGGRYDLCFILFIWSVFDHFSTLKRSQMTITNDHMKCLRFQFANIYCICLLKATKSSVFIHPILIGAFFSLHFCNGFKKRKICCLTMAIISILPRTKWILPSHYYPSAAR